MMQNTIPPTDPKPRHRGMFASALAFALVALANATGVLAACPGPGRAEVRLLSETPRPQYRHALTRPQIATVEGGHAAGDHSRAGLTHSQTGISINPLVESVLQPDGTLCATVRRVDVTWKMTLFLVDIAAEYKPGSCPYNEIVRHENQHVAIHQRAFLAAQQDIRQRVTEALRREPTFVIRGTPKQAAETAAARIMAAAQPAVARYEADTRRLNASIDTPENYRSVSARCRDW